MRRVVVTGLGLVTPLASGVEESWTRLLDGQSGAGPITQFDAEASGVTTTYACEVPRGDGSGGTFNPDDWVAKKDQKKIDDFHPLWHRGRRHGCARRRLDARG